MQKSCCNQNVLKELDALVQNHVLCGYSCGFVQSEVQESFYGGVQGCIPPYQQRSIDRRMLYDLASLTKVVATTTRILQYMDAGILHRQTKVKSILPDYVSDQTDVQSLLFHTSGLPSDLGGKEQLRKESIRSAVYAVHPDASKVGQVLYSDIGFMLLGFIIEKIDGSLEKGCQKHIFKPLGMQNTSWIQNKESDRYLPTEITIERGCICKDIHDRKAFLLGQSGAAGLFSTLEDLMLFVQALLQKNTKLFSRGMYDRLYQDSIQNRSWGWAKPYSNHVLYHTGFTGTSILIDLHKQKGMILLTNRIHPTRHNEAFLKEREKINTIYLEEENET